MPLAAIHDQVQAFFQFYSREDYGYMIPWDLHSGNLDLDFPITMKQLKAALKASRKTILGVNGICKIPTTTFTPAPDVLT